MERAQDATEAYMAATPGEREQIMEMQVKLVYQNTLALQRMYDERDKNL